MLKDSALHLRNASAELHKIANKLTSLREASDVSNAAQQLKDWGGLLAQLAADMAAPKEEKKHWTEKYD